jgi:dTDP-4-dehydrorhamnose 3,5-epimerase
MEFRPTSIPEVVLIEPKIYGDERGFFMEVYRSEQFLKAGINAHFVQDNHSGSTQGILRGLHYQIKHVQGKLVRVIAGHIFDVAVDLRRSSPTFGQWTGQYLSAQNKMQIWIPEGFAHGFYVLSDWAEVVYKVTDYYAPEWERTLSWNDPEIGIKWPLVSDGHPILSTKDSQGEGINNTDLFD